MNKKYSRQALDHLAQNVVKGYDPELLLREPCPIPIEELMEFQCELRIRYECLSKNGAIHGMTIFQDGLVPVYDSMKKVYTNTIASVNDVFIDKSLLGKNRVNRLRFTLAHEMAHWLIHQEQCQQESGIACKTSHQFTNQIERDADYLAAAILMPQGRVRVAFKRHKNLIHDAIVHQLAYMFQVSTQAMALRLSDLNLSGRRYESVAVEDYSKRKKKNLRCPHCGGPIGEIVSDNKPFGVNSLGLDLNIVCNSCKEEANFLLENT